MDDTKTSVRINKYLAHRGIAARREADRLIERGFVFINGTRAKLGSRVLNGDTVTISGPQRRYTYLAYHKLGGVVTHSARPNEKEIPNTFMVGGRKVKVFPLGRLDKDSSGLIILTNDGRITDRLLNPKFGHSKTYEVTLDKPVQNRLLKEMRRGMRIERDVAKPARAERCGPCTLRITLSEGKKHQIRRMCAALGYRVTSLRRVRIENVPLGKIPPGGWSEIKEKDRTELLKKLGL